MAGQPPAGGGPPQPSHGHLGGLPCWRPPTRYSVANLAIVRRVARFTKTSPRLREIVRRLGFRFIYHIPSRFFSDLDLFAWLLFSFHSASSHFVVGDTRITADLSLLRSLLDLKPGTDPKDIISPKTFPQTVESVAAMLCYDCEPKRISVARAESVLRQLQHRTSLSPQEEAASRAAVTIVAVGSFIAPRPGTHEVHGDVLRAIDMHDDNRPVDWATHALDVLKEASDGVQHELLHSRTTSLLDVYGCAPFFMVRSHLSSLGGPLVIFPSFIGHTPHTHFVLPHATPAL